MIIVDEAKGDEPSSISAASLEGITREEMKLLEELNNKTMIALAQRVGSERIGKILVQASELIKYLLVTPLNGAPAFYASELLQEFIELSLLRTPEEKKEIQDAIDKINFRLNAQNPSVN